jgi:hypothetical protein
VFHFAYFRMDFGCVNACISGGSVRQIKMQANVGLYFQKITLGVELKKIDDLQPCVVRSTIRHIAQTSEMVNFKVPQSVF